MKLQTVVLLEQRVNLGLGLPRIVTIPERQHTYAPTLATVHRWLWQGWGPFYISWRDGLLCPFHPQVKHKNMTCCTGQRGVGLRRCSGLGMLIELDDVLHLSPHKQRQLIGRVVCYEWCHHLAQAYWAISRQELIKMPDDSQLLITHLMRTTYKQSGWLDWHREKKERESKKKLDWLGPMPCAAPLRG